jgi:flagellar M-ring protein FliF
MNARLDALWANLTAFAATLPTARRALLLATGVATTALVFGLAWWVQRPLYRPLFTNLVPADAAAITEALKAEHVDYTLDDGGRAVLVPQTRLYDLRLSLAARGLPEGGGAGFELFDRQVLGQTDFVQHLNYQRALQGELARTIAQLGGVESARVHLAIPERSVFVSQDREPSASVVVKLAAGRSLAHAQIDGIVHLVASSVQGMAPDAVTVVDEGGRMLTAGRQGDDGIAATGSAIDYQRGIERGLEERIESLLATVVGTGKVIARVAATVDFSRTERTEETVDPDKTAIKASHAVREDAGPHAAAPAATDKAPRAERRDESQEYEVSRTKVRTIAPVGSVKSLSVAVLVDGTYREENGRRTFVPRTAAELEQLRTLVASAAGITDARGDHLELTSAPFQAPDATPGPEPGPLARIADWAPAVFGRLLGAGLVVALLALVVRPLVTALGATATPPRPRVLDRDVAMSELARENLALAQQNPERAAQLVRQWLLESQRSA